MGCVESGLGSMRTDSRLSYGMDGVQFPHNPCMELVERRKCIVKHLTKREERLGEMFNRMSKHWGYSATYKTFQRDILALSKQGRAHRRSILNEFGVPIDTMVAKSRKIRRK